MIEDKADIKSRDLSLIRFLYFCHDIFIFIIFFRNLILFKLEEESNSTCSRMNIFLEDKKRNLILVIKEYTSLL